MALVLCTGVDATLIETRKLILEAAGHTVIAATHELAVVTACKQNRFDVAVVGQAILPAKKREIESLVRQHCPSAKILELYSPHEGKRLRNADSWLEVPAQVPAELAERVTELASRTGS